ncbi:MAG: hypothetical protein QW379_06275 [Thermoplasmata archaeon]
MDPGRLLSRALKQMPKSTWMVYCKGRWRLPNVSGSIRSSSDILRAPCLVSVSIITSLPGCETTRFPLKSS